VPVRREAGTLVVVRAARFLVTLLLGAATLAGCTGDAAVDQRGSTLGYVQGSGERLILPVAERPAAPEVRGTLLDGAPYSIADLRGKVVVLNWWGSWCGPCLAEADDLQQVYEQTAADGVAFVGINVRDQRSLASAHERRFGVTYPSLFDPSGRTALRFRTLPPTSTPATVVLDRQGRIAARFLTPVLAGDLLPVVQRVAAEQPAQAAQVPAGPA